MYSCRSSHALLPQVETHWVESLEIFCYKFVCLCLWYFGCGHVITAIRGSLLTSQGQILRLETGGRKSGYQALVMCKFFNA